MITQSRLFVLFLVAAGLATTSVQAQSMAAQPAPELSTALEAYRLGQAIPQTESPIDTALKNDHCSTDALHWTFVSPGQENTATPALTPSSPSPLPAAAIDTRPPAGKWANQPARPVLH